MSKSVLIMGDSGSGKTTSLRTLDPKSTFIFDIDGKGLSWKGWKNQYSAKAGNYYRNNSKVDKNHKTTASLNANTIIDSMLKINKEKPEIKVIVVDTLNWVMINDEEERMKEKSYDKWQDLAYSIRAVIAVGNTLRDDLTVIYTAHTQTERDDSGYMYTRMKTSGKRLDKICVESMFSTVLMSVCKDGEYVFQTQSRNSTAKSPMGAFEKFEIPNDAAEVVKALEEF